MKIQEQVALNQDALDCYKVVADAYPDAETGENNWYHSAAGTAAGEMLEFETVNGMTYFFRSFVSGTYTQKVYSTNGPISTDEVIKKMMSDPKTTLDKALKAVVAESKVSK